jgi:hypothetical protein
MARQSDPAQSFQEPDLREFLRDIAKARRELRLAGIFLQAFPEPRNFPDRICDLDDEHYAERRGRDGHALRHCGSKARLFEQREKRRDMPLHGDAEGSEDAGVVHVLNGLVGLSRARSSAAPAVGRSNTFELSATNF